MNSKQAWAGVALLALSVVTAWAAPGKPSTAAGGRYGRPGDGRVIVRPVSSRRATTKQAVKPRARRTAASRSTRLAATRPVTRARAGKYLRMAQATPSEQPPMPSAAPQTVPQERAGTISMRTEISPEAEPLMIRALSAYFVTDESMLRDLRSRGWSFADLATAGNLAVRSQRPLPEVAYRYDQRRDWVAVAGEVNVPADDLYIAANAPRYVMIRPTLEEELRMAAAATPPAPELATVPAQPAPTTAAPGVAAPPSATQPPAPGAAAAQPPAALQPGAAAQPRAAAQPGAVAQPGVPPPAVTPPGAVAPGTPGAVPSPLAETPPPAPAPRWMTPVERVAASRLEMLPREPGTLLHRAVATYYALSPLTVRELASKGWSLEDILLAGNLAYRSEATLEEIVSLREAGHEWSAVAERVGMSGENLYQPAISRRVTTAYDRRKYPYDEERMEREERELERDRRDQERERSDRERDSNRLTAPSNGNNSHREHR